MKIDKTHPRFEEITEDFEEVLNKEDRRGSNFFCNLLYKVDDGSDLDGYWMSNRLIGDHDDGVPADCDDIRDLTKVEPIEKTIITKIWTPIKDQRKDTQCTQKQVNTQETL